MYGHSIPTRTAFALCTLFTLALGSTALATPGDIGIFTDTTGGETVFWDGITMLTHDFTAGAVRSTTGISLNGPQDGVNLDAGHYLVMYNSFWNSSGGSQRREIQSKLHLAGSDLPIGWSQAFIRRQNGQDEAITTGAGIINVSSDGDLLQLQSFRTDNENNAATRGAQTGLQILELDESWDYLRLSRGTDQAGPTDSGTANAVEVAYDVVDEPNANFGFTSGSSNITLTEGGKYLIVANTFLQTPAQPANADSDRTPFTQRLTLNDTEIAGSRTGVYIRENPDSDSAHDGAVSIAAIIDSTAGQQLSVDIAFDPINGAGGGQSSPSAPVFKADRTALTIAKLPDDGNYIRLTETAGTQNINDANAVTWGNQVEPGSPTFTHTAGTSAVTVDADGDYLFLSTLYTDDTAAARAYPESFFQVNNATTTPYGRSGFYTRNQSDGSGAGQSGGNFNGILLDLNNGDFVELETNPLGNSGTLVLDHGSFQGVQVSSILIPEPSTFALAALGLLAWGWRRER